MVDSLGVIKGQMILDVKQALAAYTAARAAHISTMTALSTGASALAGVSAGIAGVGIVIGAGLAMAVTAASEFERKLDYFASVSQSTQAEYDAIREKALQLGQDTIFSAGQIADSFVELGKSGVEAKDIINGIGEGVAALGAAADIPLDRAANIMMSAVQTFGLGSDQAVHVADVLAGAANASIVEIEDLGVSLKYAGGVAAALGIPFEDVATALGLLGTYGLKGSTAGTSLRQILVSLGGATKKATAQLEDLGIITEDGANKFFNADGSAKSLSEIFQILQDATAGMGDEQRLAALKTIFQNRALASAIALTKEGSDGFAEMAEAIGKTTAAEVASERLDNLSGDIEILRGNIETLAIEAGSVLQEFFRGVVQGLTDVIQWFSNLSPATQEFIVKALAIAAIALVVIGAFGLFAAGILNVINLFLRLAPVFTLLRTGLGLVITGFRLLATAMLTNPVGLIITGILILVGVFIYLWQTNEGFRNFWIQLWETIKGAAIAVWEWFQTLPALFATIWTNISTGVSTVWNAILEFFRSIPGKIMEFFLNWTLPGLLIQHWDTISSAIYTAWNAVLDWFGQLPGRMANFFSELPGKLGYWIGFAIGTSVRLLTEFVAAAIDLAIQVYSGIVDWISKLPGRIGEFFAQIWENGVAFWTQVRDWTIETVTSMVNGIIDWFQKLPGRVSDIWNQVYNGIRNWVEQAAIWTTDTVQNLVNNVIEWFQQLPGRISDIWNQVVTTIREAAERAWEAARDLGQNILEAVANGIEALPGLVMGILNNAIDAIYGVVQRAFNAAADFASGLWEGFKDGLGIHSPSYIERAMWAITGVVGDETDRLSKQARAIQGLGNGINELGGMLGVGFGENFNQGLVAMADQVKQAQKYEMQLHDLAASTTLGSEVGITTSQTLTLDTINDTLAELAARPQVVTNIENVNNPVPERTTDTLNRYVRKSAYIGGNQ